MKKYLFLFLMIYSFQSLHSQTQGSWILPGQPYLTDVNRLFFEPELFSETINTVYTGDQPLNSAAAFNSNGDLLFFTIGYYAYLYGGGEAQFIFTHQEETSGFSNPDIEIIRKPGGNINSYYIIYVRTGNSQLNGDNEPGWIAYTEVIYDDINQTILKSNSEIITQFFNFNSGIAITEEEGSLVYIYYTSVIDGLCKIELGVEGFGEITLNIVEPGDFGNTNYFKSYKLELNETENIMAWNTCYDSGKDNLLVVDLDSPTNPQKFDLNHGDINGLEFSTFESGFIYVSCEGENPSTGGIYKVNYTTGNVSGPLSNTLVYNKTYLQLALDGNIYGVKNTGTHLGKINMDDGSFAADILQINVTSYSSDGDFYVLPENHQDFEPLTLIIDTTVVSCPGDCNGTATAIPSGGTPPYTYLWSTGQTSQTINNLCEGEYWCKVTDQYNNEETINFVITANPLLFTHPGGFWEPIQQTYSSFNYSFEAGIRIYGNKTVTFTNCNFQFGKNAKVIIEQGSKLIMNNTVFTYLEVCGNMWQGVEIWGNSIKSQYRENGVYYQGTLIMNNNSFISYAKSAIQLWKPVDPATAGGIVQANNSHFVNNAKSVHFLPYNNYNPGIPGHPFTDNFSYFRYCTFEINNNYIPDYEFYKHADLNKVKGIRFTACEFSVVPTAGVNTWNQAIASYSSGFSVSAVCTSQHNPCDDWDESTFTGFQWGITATNDGSNNNTLNVQNAIFTNNAYGIRMSTVHNAVILFNAFNVGLNAAEEGECEGEGKQASGIGIDLNYCTGFAIEENEFTKTPGAPAGTYTGIRIAETEATDQVYKNTFEGLSYGNYAVGKNWKNNEYWNGLAYYCNENTGNWRDFNVTKNNQIPPTGGIQDPIGSTQMTAGNTFTENANSNFYNDGNYWIGYYFYAPTPGNHDTPYYPDAVFRVTREEVVGIENQCLSHYGSGGGGSGSGRGLVLTPEEKQQAELEFATGLSDYNNVKNLYENLKDGGNTTATVSDIETAWPLDMWELRAELLGKSPHLSMEVLKTAADKTNVLPDNVIFEIMAANPDELKMDELIKYLEDKENPLPGYMIDILKQVATGSTYKTVLRQQMAHYNQLKTRAVYDIVRSLLNDSVSNNNELRNWLDNIGGKRADEQIIASYMNEGNFTNALSLANLMPSLYGYTGNELTEHNYFTDMLNLQINLVQQGRTIFELDSTEVANLEFVAGNSNGTAAAQAKGILEFAYGYHYCNCIEGDGTGYKSSGNFNYDAFSKVFGPDVEVKPNPAGEWTTFNYSLPAIDSDGVIKISDVNGKIIETFVVSGTQGQKVWDTRKINNGVYLFTFESNGISKSGKIVISK